MIEQLNTIAGLWWNWAAAMFWQVGLLIVLIASIDRLTRKWTWPQLRYALWSLVLIKLILPPTLWLPSSVAPRLAPVVTEVWNAATDEGRKMGNSLAHADPGDDGGETAWASKLPILLLAADDRRVGLAHREIVPEEAGVQSTPYTEVASVNPQSAIRNPQLTWQFYAMSLWLAGAAALAALLAFRLRSLSRTDKRASNAPPLPESFYNQVSGCAGRLGLRHLPRVVVTDKVTCPAVFGVLRPVLLVPRGYLRRLSRRDTEHMLLHELAHVKRGDLLAHGFYMLLAIVYWYNPLLWLVRRQIHHLRELCCDATVANLLRDETGAYRQTLLDTARRFLATRTEPGLGLLGLFEDSNRLLVRLNWLDKPTWRYRRMKRTIVIAIVGLMLACVLPMAHSQPPEPAAPAEVEAIETPAPEMSPEQFAWQVAQLERQMQQLQQQRQQLQQQMQQMHVQMAQLHQQRTHFVRDTTSDTLFQTYTVRPGDTLAGIAGRFSDSDDGRKETFNRIVKANELASADPLRVGQELRIPLSDEQAEMVRRELAAASRSTGTKLEAKKAKDAAVNARFKTIDADTQAMQARTRMQQQLQQVEQVEQWKQWQEQMQAWGEKYDEEYHRAHNAGAVTDVPPMPAMPAMPPMPAMPAMPYHTVSPGAAPAPDVVPDVALPDVKVPEAAARVPVLSDLPMMGRLFANVPNEDAVLDLRLPERVTLIQLMDLVGKHANLAYVYDPEVVKGEVALRLGGNLQGQVRVGELYRLLESALRFKNLAMVRRDGNIVTIVPADKALEADPPLVGPVPTLNDIPTVEPPISVPHQPGVKAAVDADYVVKALKRGTELRIQNNVGSMKIQGVPGRDCAIKVKVEAKAATPEEAEEIAKKVLIQVTPRDDIVEIGVQFPDEMSEEQRKTVQVHFDMTIPQDCMVRAAQNIGDIYLAGLGDSAVQARTNVGTIRTWDLQGKVMLNVNVGDIDVTMPVDPSVKVRASAKVGAIKSDLPLDVTSASVMRAGDAQSALGSSATGTLGGGADKLDVTTNVGSIRIRSAGATPADTVF